MQCPFVHRNNHPHCPWGRRDGTSLVRAKEHTCSAAVDQEKNEALLTSPALAPFAKSDKEGDVEGVVYFGDDPHQTNLKYKYKYSVMVDQPLFRLQ